MTLDKQLREILGEEGDSRVTPLPDLAGLIGGGRARRRRRRVAQAATALAALVLIGGTAYGLGQVDLGGSGTKPEIADRSSEPLEPSGDREPIEPGAYTYFVSADQTGERIEVDLTLDGSGWVESDHPLLVEDGHAAGVGIYRAARVASASGCSSAWQGRVASQTLRGLARQLGRLPQGTVLQPPTQTTLQGHRALRLSMRIADQCPMTDYYSVADVSTGVRGVTYTSARSGVLIDFWVVDLDGTTIVVDSWHDVGAPQDLVDRATSARISLEFLPVD